jgi:hypothetical protein
MSDPRITTCRDVIVGVVDQPIEAFDCWALEDMLHPW